MFSDFSMKTPDKHKAIMLELIEMYRNMPCLWNRRHNNYSIRWHRMKALKALLAKYREIDEEACLSNVQNKLDIIRGGFIRELRKVRLSKMSSDKSKLYIPRLWYYDSLTFLEDQYCPGKGKKTYNRSEAHIDSDEENPSSFVENDSYIETEILEENSKSSTEQDEIPRNSQVAEEPGSYSDEENEIIGKSIALQMKDLDPYQSAIAQKLIFDAIYYAKLGKLNVDSYVAVNHCEKDIDEYTSD